MTAVIGILNKTGVAIAADSAVTVSNPAGSRRKVYNTANKIFKLSKYHPVGIVIYNSASFIKTPWETIIKMYREWLGKTSFSTIPEYKDSLIAYVKSHPEFYSQYAQKFCVSNLIHSLVKEALDDVDRYLPEDFDALDKEAQIESINTNLKKVIQVDIDICRNNPSTSGEFDGFTIENFKSLSGLNIQDAISLELEDLSEEVKHLFLEYLYEYIKSDRFYVSDYSGLVFVGFGDTDIYPNCVTVEVGEIVDAHLRYNITVESEISDERTSAILPFAQRDVIDTVIYGVAPDLKSVYTQTFVDLLKKYNDTLIDIFTKANLSAIANIIRAVDIKQYAEEFDNKIQDYQIKEYVLPTRMTTALLSKEDLAEMAESLIYLTYLKRRFTSKEESVGGPVDVAVISKSDGFVWIKRKYYFKPELNPHFFHTYFEKNPQV